MHWSIASHHPLGIHADLGESAGRLCGRKPRWALCAEGCVPYCACALLHVRSVMHRCCEICAPAVEDLQPKEGFREKAYVRSALAGRTLDSLRLLESHGDQVRYQCFATLHACTAHLTSNLPHQVLELPPGAELLAQSSTAANEIWTFQDRALAIQGHPEMPVSEAQTKILPFLADNGWGCCRGCPV